MTQDEKFGRDYAPKVDKVFVPPADRDHVLQQGGASISRAAALEALIEEVLAGQ